MAKSLAFWVENSQEKERDVTTTDGTQSEKYHTNFELHFNFWSLTSGKSKKHGEVNYLDIGVRLSQITDFSTLSFFLPFPRSSYEYIKNLGERVAADDEMASAIFNSRAGNFTTNIAGTKDFELTKKGESSSIRFFTHLERNDNDAENWVSIFDLGEGENLGSIIRFPKKLFKFSDDCNQEGYFRFRLVLGKKAKGIISQLYEPSDRSVTSHFEVTEMVDFRLNEARNLPVTVQRSLDRDSHINAVHFFLIREACSEFKMSHSEYNRCRVLEKDIWDKYLQEDMYESGASQMLIYHWKKIENDGSIDDFSAFAKFTRRRVRRRDLWMVIGVAFLVGGLASSLVNFIWAGLPDWNTSSAKEKNVQLNACRLDSTTDKQTNFITIVSEQGPQHYQLCAPTEKSGDETNLSSQETPDNHGGEKE